MRLGHAAELTFSDPDLAIGSHTLFTFGSGDAPDGIVPGDLLVIQYSAQRDVTGGTAGGVSVSDLPAGWTPLLASFTTGPITPTETAISARILYRIADGTSADLPTIGATRAGPGGNTVAVYATAHMFAYHFADEPAYSASGSWNGDGPETGLAPDTPPGFAALGLSWAVNFPGTPAPSLTVGSESAHVRRASSTTTPASAVADSIFGFPGVTGGDYATPSWDDAVAAGWATFSVEMFRRPPGLGITTGTPLGLAGIH